MILWSAIVELRWSLSCIVSSLFNLLIICFDLRYYRFEPGCVVGIPVRRIFVTTGPGHRVSLVNSGIVSTTYSL